MPLFAPVTMMVLPDKSGRSAAVHLRLGMEVLRRHDRLRPLPARCQSAFFSSGHGVQDQLRAPEQGAGGPRLRTNDLDSKRADPAVVLEAVVFAGGGHGGVPGLGAER